MEMDISSFLRQRSALLSDYDITLFNENLLMMDPSACLELLRWKLKLAEHVVLLLKTDLLTVLVEEADVEATRENVQRFLALSCTKDEEMSSELSDVSDQLLQIMRKSYESGDTKIYTTVVHNLFTEIRATLRYLESCLLSGDDSQRESLQNRIEALKEVGTTLELLTNEERTRYTVQYMNFNSLARIVEYESRSEGRASSPSPATEVMTELQSFYSKIMETAQKITAKLNEEINRRLARKQRELTSELHQAEFSWSSTQDSESVDPNDSPESIDRRECGHSMRDAAAEESEAWERNRELKLLLGNYRHYLSYLKLRYHSDVPREAPAFVPDEEIMDLQQILRRKQEMKNSLMAHLLSIGATLERSVTESAVPLSSRSELYKVVAMKSKYEAMILCIQTAYIEVMKKSEKELGSTAEGAAYSPEGNIPVSSVLSEKLAGYLPEGSDPDERPTKLEDLLCDTDTVDLDLTRADLEGDYLNTILFWPHPGIHCF